MPNKFLEEKGITIKKQKYQVTNWSEYNAALKSRGNINIWLHQSVLEQWYHLDQVYDGTGRPENYTDFAILTIHEVRQVYKLPLRQTQGFIDSIFQINNLPIQCPDFSTLSKRLKKLGIKTPKYKKTDVPDCQHESIAIDSTGLKRFGRDEWHQEKHEVSAKRSWRKLHVAIDENHLIQSAILTDRFVQDEEVVEDLLEQIENPIAHMTGDGAYDKTPVYQQVEEHSTKVEIVIPPSKNAVISDNSHEQRNRNLLEIQTSGRMCWQKERNYGRRNYSELAIQRYKRILGRSMHARDMGRQTQEALIGCGVLNKMTLLGMPVSKKIA